MQESTPDVLKSAVDALIDPVTVVPPSPLDVVLARKRRISRQQDKARVEAQARGEAAFQARVKARPVYVSSESTCPDCGLPVSQCERPAWLSPRIQDGPR